MVELRQNEVFVVERVFVKGVVKLEVKVKVSEDLYYRGTPFADFLIV